MSSTRAGAFLALVTTLTVSGIAYVHYGQAQEKEVRPRIGPYGPFAMQDACSQCVSMQELFKGVLRDTERINQKLAERRAT